MLAESGKDQIIVPKPIQKAVLEIARCRFHKGGDEIRVREIITRHPELSTQRAIAFFPEDGHLEIAQGIMLGHTGLWRERYDFCRENGFSLPQGMISGEYFVLGRPFIQLDVLTESIPSPDEDFQPLIRQGYTVLNTFFLPV